MPTDYVLFIHGVNTRESAADPTYADQLFGLIQKQAGSPFQSQQVAEGIIQAIVESTRVV